MASGLEEALRQHVFITIPLCFWACSEWFRPRLGTMMKIFIGVCTFHSLITLILFVVPESMASDLVGQFSMLQPYPDWTDRLKFGLYTPFLERLNLAYLLGFGLLYLIYDSLRHAWTWLNVVQGIILLIAFLLIGARGAQLALLGGLGIGALSYLIDKLKSLNLPKEKYLERLTSAITILIIGLIATPYITYKTVPAVQKRYDQMQWELRLINNGDYLQEEYQYFTSLTRIRAWQNAGTIIRENPILGVGIGDYDNALLEANMKYDDKVPVHNQNFFFYLCGAVGVLGLLTMLWGLWQYTRSYWGGERRPIRHLALAYVVFICISCMVDAFLKYHIGSVSVMLFLSVLFLLNQPDRVEVA